MKTLLHSLVFFFNFFAVTNIKFDGKKWLTSKFVTLKNLLVFLFIVLTVNFSVPSSYSDVTQRKGQYNHAALSVLYIFVFSFIIILYRMIAAVFIFVQILRRHEIASLLNTFSAYAKNYISTASISKFKNKIIKLIGASSMLHLFCCLIEFTAFFSPNLDGLVRSIWFHIHGAMTYYFLLFVCLIFNFILVILDDLLKDVESTPKNLDRSFLNQILIKFEIAQKLVNRVEKIFGPILTFVMFFTMVLLVSKVKV